jgi:hypothetical protein
MDRSWKIEKKGFHILFVGDSHIEQSIFDEDRKEIKTFAQSGDNYLYTYSKFKKILLDNSDIDTVFIGIDYHNVDLTAREWYSSQSYLDYKFPQCFPFMGVEDFKVLFTYNPIGFVKSIPNLIAINDLQFKRDYLNMYGSFQASDSVIISLENATSKYVNSPSKLQFYYLNKIIDLCKSNNIKPILITTPIHTCLERNLILEDLILNFAHENNLSYINSRELKLPNSYYRNSSHLNTNGAIFYTNYLFKYLHQ